MSLVLDCALPGVIVCSNISNNIVCAFIVIMSWTQINKTKSTKQLEVLQSWVAPSTVCTQLILQTCHVSKKELNHPYVNTSVNISLLRQAPFVPSKRAASVTCNSRATSLHCCSLQLSAPRTKSVIYHTDKGLPENRDNVVGPRGSC